MDVQWWSIEVRDGVLPAQRWKDGYGEALLEAAVTNGAHRWEWAIMPGGVLLELAFPDPAQWARFRALPVVTAALDATPDPVNGLYVYQGRGGSAGAVTPRRTPRPAGSGAAAVPLPAAPPTPLRLAETEPPAERVILRPVLSSRQVDRGQQAGPDRLARWLAPAGGGGPAGARATPAA